MKKIPDWLQGPLAAVGFLGAVSLAANSIKNDVQATLIFNGTPAEVESAIRAKFPDKVVQEGVIESLYRRLEYVAGSNGRVISLSGGFYVDADHENSLFTEGFDHSQRAKVEIKHDDGTTEVVIRDISEVPNKIIDNSLQISSEGQ